MTVPPSDFGARRAFGRASRARAPRSSHAGWVPGSARIDPITLLEEQAESRVAELVPIRYGRMLVSPFTFYRGAALIMAADLATTPDSGIVTQLCGDAHLSNFGIFGTPERNLVFDINDFDETLPGPWEWDVKRLVTSFEVAGRHRGFSPSVRRSLTLEAARAYREQMNKAAEAPVLESWYDRIGVDQLLEEIQNEKHARRVTARQARHVGDVAAKARTRDSMRAFSKLVRVVEGELQFVADPPLIEPIESLIPDPRERQQAEDSMSSLLRSYRSTLSGVRHPLDDFRYLHMARKVVGVGSVGTRAWVLLLEGRDAADPLILQAKEAQASVLERFLGSSAFEHHGERVVAGQQLMQSASDIFLGWQRVEGVDGVSRDFYVRQLHDWKGSFDIDVMRPSGARFYAHLCGEALARGHARSGDRVAISAYLGRGDRFDRAIADFADAYADQNERDYEAFAGAVSSGRLTALAGH